MELLSASDDDDEEIGKFDGKSTYKSITKYSTN